MFADEKVQAIASRVLHAEANAIINVAASLDKASWAKAVKLIADCQGKLILFGLGKTGHIGKKLAATFASLGTPAFFLHAAEAAHGDLGMLEDTDVVIAISNSGESAELTARLAYITNLGCPLIAMTRSAESTLGQAATVCLLLPVEQEADKWNLAPTVSSTLALAAGDALAIAVAELKGFSREQFGLRHPGGALGKIANG